MKFFLVFLLYSSSLWSQSNTNRLNGWWQCVSVQHGKCMFAGFQSENNQIRFFWDENDKINVVFTSFQITNKGKISHVKLSKIKNEANPNAKLLFYEFFFTYQSDTLWITNDSQEIPFVRIKPEFPSIKLQGVWEPIEKITPQGIIPPPPISFEFNFQTGSFWHNAWITEDLFKRKAQWSYIPFLNKILICEGKSNSIWNLQVIELKNKELILSEIMRFGHAIKIKFIKSLQNNK